jgi:hypothetical protein
VDEYDLIRRKHLIGGLSLRAISRELGYARNTVAKAIANPIPPGYRLSRPRARPTIDPVTAHRVIGPVSCGRGSGRAGVPPC